MIISLFLEIVRATQLGRVESGKCVRECARDGGENAFRIQPRVAPETWRQRMRQQTVGGHQLGIFRRHFEWMRGKQGVVFHA